MESGDRVIMRTGILGARPWMASVWPAVLVWLLSLAQPASALLAAAETKGSSGPCGAQAAAKAKKDAAAKAAAERAKKRAEAVTRLAARLGVGQGGVVADIGAGSGVDTWTFAAIVGTTGTVYAEEITENLVKSLRAEAEKRKLPQVRPVQGRDDDPALPQDSVDLAHMRYVYHHVSKPREMLRAIRQALKPGGYLVVVDRNRGTLRDWVPREQRKQKHFWLAETTVVREAREEGFAFSGCAEDCCDVPEPFVLVFQRPKDRREPGRDPDSFLPLRTEELARGLVPLTNRYAQPAFLALGEARQLMRPILQRSSGTGLDIVLEEWATQKDERPALPPGVSLPSVLTDQGDFPGGAEPISAVFFLDTYHLLFHGKTLLSRLRERLAPNGCVYVLDREAKGELSRREASHRRQIRRETVKQEMAAAGFSLWCEGPRPAPDRFLLLFGKAKSEEVAPENDPLVGGPRIERSPGEWLKDNLWRLRGLRTADGKLVRLARPAARTSAERANSTAPEVETWRLPTDGLLLSFKKTDQGFLLTEARARHPGD